MYVIALPTFITSDFRSKVQKREIETYGLPVENRQVMAL